MSLPERLAGGLKATFAARVLNMLSNAVLIVLLTRFLLDPSEYGLLQFAIAILGVVQLFGSLGVPRSAARYVTEYVETDATQVPHILRTTVVYIVAIAVVVSVLLGVSSGVVARFLGEPALVPLLLVGTAYAAFYSLKSYLNLVFQAFNRVDLSATLQSVEAVVRILVAPALAFGYAAVGALVGYTIGFVVASLVGIWLLYTRFYATIERAERREPGLARRIAEYSLPVTATRAGIVLDNKVDTILVGALLNPTAVGYYALAAQVVDFTMVPAKSLGFTISPAIGEQSASDRRERAARIYESSLEYVLLLYVPAVVGLVVVAEPTVRYVFGSDYLGAVPVLQILSGFVLASAVHEITGDTLDYLGEARVRAYARGVTAGANFGLNLLLIPSFGVVGAAAATLVTYGLYALVNVYYIHRELSLRTGHIARSAALVCGISLGMGAVVVGLFTYISSLVSLLAVVGLSVLVWATLAVLSGLLEPRRIAAFLR